ncbi:MAG TPA: SCO family protein, partial [Candidatus Eisenbacteria bacterium]
AARVTDAAPGTGPVRAAEPSLYELAFALTDANGRARHLEEFRGRPFVASMIYTHCTSVCPRITADLQALDRALPVGLRERTRFLLFSLDPARDTPAALSAFARERGLDPARWTLLAAGADDMRTLAAVLGVRFRPDAGGEIAHSAVIVVVDRAGVIRFRQAGLTGDPTPLVAAVRAAE